MKQRAKFRVQEDNEDKNEETELIVKSTIPNIPTTEIILNDDDTLQALSIRYHCPVAEIKRLNNLHRENEIFARRTIKVPYRAIAMAHKSGDNSPETKLPKKSIDAHILKERLSSVSVSTSLPSCSSSNGVVIGNLIDIGDELLNENSSLNEIIFNTKISHKIEENDHGGDDDEVVVSEEEVQLIPNINVISDSISTSEFSCSGADWGLSWPILLGIILILAFAGPIIYLYIIEHPEKYHHHNSVKNHHNSSNR